MKYFIFLMTLTMFFVGCSKKSETPTKLKVYLAGLGTLPSGVGDGGAILFGKSSDGKSFGKRILNSEEVLDIPNGQWNFYAVFWQGGVANMSGTVYCAKSAASLNGSDVTLNLSASNANCTDSDFSNGKYFTNGLGKIQFPEIFVEDCDELPTNGYGCGLKNQGNALSYRFVFSEFKKDNTGILVSPNKFYSACKALTESDLNSSAPINFPVGSLGSPFQVQIEFFLGSTSCNPSDPKGSHTAFLNGGVGVVSPMGLLKVSSRQCDSMSASVYGSGTTQEREMRCINDLGSYSSGNCLLGSFNLSYRRFIPESSCQTASDTNLSIKHIVTIPKNRICDPYTGVSSIVGTHPFSAGDGTRFRPYKICNEWQLNQIGELGSPSSYRASHYKLMNDLDMNRVIFGIYAKPNCEGVVGALLDRFNNFNTLDGLAQTDCTTVNSTIGFTGIFWGNNKTISNLRARADVNSFGFVRYLKVPGKIFDLNFNSPDIEAKAYVGIVAGLVDDSLSGSIVNIENVKIKSPYLEARDDSGPTGNYVGTVTGQLGINSRIFNTQVFDADISGRDLVGGLVGSHSGEIRRSSFSGILEVHNQVVNSYSGGLVAQVQSNGKIYESFSEGEISTWTNFVGGIAGSNVGVIEDSYSSMILNSAYNSSGAAVGGITASNSIGNISRSVFFGKINYSGGGGGPIINGITDTGSATDSYTNHSPAGVGTYITYAQMRDGSTVPAGTFSNWQVTNGYVPRLGWESRSCMSLANRAGIAAQISLGRGTVLNPVTICDAEQLKNIGPSSTGRYYSLEENVDLSSLVGKADLVPNFYGTLLGRGNFLYGLDVTISDDSFLEYIGLIRENHGEIVNLNFSNFKITNIDPEEISVGLLVGRNNGNIKNVIASNSSIIGASKIGAIAGENEGTLDKVFTDYISIQGHKEVGGLVGHNTANGKIYRSKSSSNITNATVPSDYSHFGGIVGKNLGELNQVEFAGKMTISSVTTFAGLYAGGIAGESYGNIQNALVRQYGKIAVGDHRKVGGLVGAALNGNISTSVFLGKLYYDNGGAFIPASSYFHFLVGYLDPAVTTSHLVGSHYLSSTLINSNQLFSPTGSGPFFYNLDITALPENLVATTTTEQTDSIIPSGDYSSSIPTLVSVSADNTYMSTFDLSTKYSFNLNIYSLKSYEPQSHHAEMAGFDKTLPALFDVVSYCPSDDFSGSLGFEFCNSGFNIAYQDGGNPTNNRGMQRLINYNFTVESGGAVPPNSPIWELESDSDDGPRLVQLDD